VARLCSQRSSLFATHKKKKPKKKNKKKKITRALPTRPSIARSGRTHDGVELKHHSKAWWLNHYLSDVPLSGPSRRVSTHRRVGWGAFAGGGGGGGWGQEAGVGGYFYVCEGTLSDLWLGEVGAARGDLGRRRASTTSLPNPVRSRLSRQPGLAKMFPEPLLTPRSSPAQSQRFGGYARQPLHQLHEAVLLRFSKFYYVGQDS